MCEGEEAVSTAAFPDLVAFRSPPPQLSPSSSVSLSLSVPLCVVVVSFACLWCCSATRRRNQRRTSNKQITQKKSLIAVQSRSPLKKRENTAQTGARGRREERNGHVNSNNGSIARKQRKRARDSTRRRDCPNPPPPPCTQRGERGGHVEGVTAEQGGEREITHWTASLCGSQGGKRASRGSAAIRRRAAAHLRVLGERALINAGTAPHR